MELESQINASSSQIETIPAIDSATLAPPVLKLRLHKKKPAKKVIWTESTVDNEHMNKKKSKCCCIYKKPLNFGESSSEEEEECENCFGHPEKRNKNCKNLSLSDHSLEDANSFTPDKDRCSPE